MRNRCWPALFALIWLALALAPGAGLAQNVTASPLAPDDLRARLAHGMAPPGQPMPADQARLDAWVAARDWGPLNARLAATPTASDVLLQMNWEEARLIAGAPLVVSIGYMRDLWRIAPVAPKESIDELKGQAVLAFLYSLELVMVDGQRCADPSAPGRHIDQLFAQARDIRAWALTLPRQERMVTIGSSAVALEKATSGIRADDDAICRGGLAEMNAALAAQPNGGIGDQLLTASSVGRNIVLPPAPGFKPAFLPPPQYADKVAKARDSLPAVLTRILSTPEEAAAAQTGK